MEKALCIYNPGSGSLENPTERLGNAVDHLLSHGLPPHVAMFDSKKREYKAADKADKHDCPLIIDLCGDGMIGVVAPALVGSNTRLGILVGGTQNNLAHCLGIPADLSAASTIIVKSNLEQRYLLGVKNRKESEGREDTAYPGVNDGEPGF